ncbi:unnamed protein product [marine sediment metagenome]|uniref:Branched-chain amino acid ABC transporter permease n=1 Tax=marine sediment metagenome TaxID=412755 RepID=X1A324_9ZZZZ
MRIFLEQMINGLTIGSFYALIALGYSMVYGVMKLINFAPGILPIPPKIVAVNAFNP